LKGGVLYTHIESIGIFINCYFTNNFASEGGVAYINDNGLVNMNNNIFIDNCALDSSILYFMNTQIKSNISDSNYTNVENLNIEKLNLIISSKDH
jgi:hypothetical protein